MRIATSTTRALTLLAAAPAAAAAQRADTRQPAAGQPSRDPALSGEHAI